MGQVGGSRRVFMERTPLFKGGEASMDRVLERRENAYWKIEISDFKTWSMGFSKFQGEWTTERLSARQVRVCYRYTMFSHSVLLYPLHWFFTKVIWRGYMRQALDNVRKLAEEEAPYLHAIAYRFTNRAEPSAVRTTYTPAGSERTSNWSRSALR